MGIIKGIAKFTVGTATGAVVGAAAGLLLARDSGPEFQRKLRERFRAAKVAGVEAQAAKENELIRKYRLTVSDAKALKDSEEQTRTQRAASLERVAAESR